MVDIALSAEAKGIDVDLVGWQTALRDHDRLVERTKAVVLWFEEG